MSPMVTRLKKPATTSYATANYHGKGVNALCEGGPRFFEHSVPQAIESVLVRAHPVDVLENQVLKAPHPTVERQ